MKRKNKNKGFIKNSIEGIKLMYNSNPKMLLIYIVFVALHGLSWVLQVIFMQKFFDAAENFAIHKINFQNILLALLAMGISYAFCQLMNGVDNCYALILNMNVGKTLNKLIYKKVSSLNIIEFENTERLNFINMAINGSKNLVWVCATLLDTIFFYSVYFLFVAWYLFKLKPILGISILVIFIPCILSKTIQSLTFEKLEDNSAPLRRKCEYYERCMTDKEFLKETRLLGAIKFFNNLYKSTLEKLNHLIFITHVKKHLLNLALDIITVIGYGIVIYMLFINVMNRNISIGAFTAVITSISRIYSFMSELISERLEWAYENLSTVKNFFDFINEKSNNEQYLTIPENSDIRVEKVCFKYPMSDKKVLDNINLVIPNNQIIAIVGENGSGKTTLCRLIMGLYAPSEGEIYYNNVSSKKLNYKNISAVFQNYCKYNMTLSENIEIAQPEKDSTSCILNDVCQQAGVNLYDESYKNGFDTMLGRDFGGTELSGGQWQRIAIARSLFRDSQLIVLDEPTAAIDPFEETRLYNNFINLCRDKTAILVTHRLGSAKIADRIIVMKDGKIIQDGTHDQLIQINGEYKTMYNAQSKWYTE